jgi:hypothetical protein
VIAEMVDPNPPRFAIEERDYQSIWPDAPLGFLERCLDWRTHKSHLYRIARLGPIWLISACLATVAWATADSDVNLVYIYSPTCGACQQFDREVAPIYPKTREAQLLPLRKIDLEAWRSGQTPFTDCSLPAVLGTPTFIHMRGCEEIDRVTGYSDQELFWLSLGRMVNRVDPK